MQTVFVLYFQYSSISSSLRNKLFASLKGGLQHLKSVNLKCKPFLTINLPQTLSKSNGKKKVTDIYTLELKPTCMEDSHL